MKKLTFAFLFAFFAIAATACFCLNATHFTAAALETDSVSEQSTEKSAVLTEQSFDSAPTSDSIVEEVEESDKKLLDELKEKIEMLTDKDYFTENILPLLIGIGSTLLTVLAAAIPFLKNNAKFKQLQGLYSQLAEENEKLTNLLKSTDLTALKSALGELLGTGLAEQLGKAVDKLKVDKVQYAEVKLEIDTILAKLDSLIQGAMQAWSAKPSAVNALTEAPEKAVLANLTRYNEALKGYIVEHYGEAALAEIEKIEANL